jgi:hypothetical protein
VKRRRGGQTRRRVRLGLVARNTKPDSILSTQSQQNVSAQARTDFAAIDGNLNFIESQLAGVPTRKQLARYSLLVMLGTTCLEQTLEFLFC